MLRAYIREVLAEMSTRYKREKGVNLPRWKEQLMKHADSGSHFVHFSFFPKLGLNPLNNYDTPTGFYAYPLQRGQIANFATDRPYAIVISPNDSGNFLNLNDYTERDLQSDIQQLRAKFGLTKRDEMNARGDARVQTPGGMIWNITRIIANSQAPEKTKRRNPAWTQEEDARYDDLLQVAEKLANVPAKDWKRKKRDLVQEFDGYARNPQNDEEDRTFWTQMTHVVRNITPNDTPAEIRRQIKTRKEFVVNPRTTGWAQIFKALGYNGVIDGGQGIIYPAEPHQAVFFSTDPLQIDDVIHKGKGGDLGELKMDKGKETNILLGQIFAGETFSDALEDTLGDDLSDSEFTNCTFQDANGDSLSFAGSKFQNCTFQNVSLDDGGLSGITCADSDFRRVTFKDTHAASAVFKSVRFTDCIFDGTDMGDALFSGCIFTNCAFQNVNFEDSIFRNSQIISPKFGLETLRLQGTYIAGLIVAPENTSLPPGYSIEPGTKKLIKVD